jgi:protein-S-isoprenylcysteine O-methyltransferase Ste14
MLFADEWLAAFLVCYFSLWVFALFFLRAWIVWRRTGVFPVILQRSDTANGYIIRRVFMLAALSTVVIVLFAFYREGYAALVPFPFLESSILRLIGVILMLPALAVMFAAQAQMGSSWRVGIDTARKTPLVTKGIYRYSRNPIYVCMLATLAGLFLALPNVVTFFVLVQCWTVLQIEARLEESYLREKHGQAYEDYCARVRRWI